MRSPAKAALVFELNMQYPIEAILTKKLKYVRLIENQLSIPVLVSLTLLFLSMLVICLDKN